MHDILHNCYKLPWTEFDSPNGWVEPTSFCNLQCPGCYRGADKKSHMGVHLPFEDVQKQVDWFVKHRNIQTLSISGGDPLLYPHLKELVEYATSKKLRTLIYSNGVALTEELLISLRDAGAQQFFVHVDEYQDRPDNPEKLEPSLIRQRYCDLFRKVGGVLLGFIQPLETNHQEYIQSVIDTAAKNIDVTSIVAFTLYRDVCWDESIKQQIQIGPTLEEATQQLMQLDGYTPTAYLSSTGNVDKATWIFGIRVGTVNGKLGYFSSNLHKKIYESYRKRTGKHLFISRKTKISLWALLGMFGFKNIRQILARYFKQLLSNGAKPVHFQSILVMRGPEKQNGKWDLCEGCPDRMIYNGQLVPSCILEDLKHKPDSLFESVNFD